MITVAQRRPNTSPTPGRHRNRLVPLLLDAGGPGDSDWPAEAPRNLTTPRFLPTASSFPSPLEFPHASPSTRFVYACLQIKEPITAGELARCSGLPGRTVRYAINWLIRHGFARRVTRLADARQNIIVLQP